jgi:hypothetical protein
MEREGGIERGGRGADNDRTRPSKNRTDLTILAPQPAPEASARADSSAGPIQSELNCPFLSQGSHKE